jgi:DNA-binding MarR family transcriptional regulator
VRAEPRISGPVPTVHSTSLAVSACPARRRLALKGHPIPQTRSSAGSRLVDIAEAAQVSKQTVGSIVDQLERAGYVERAPDPTDARAKLVRVTALGQELVQLSIPVVREVEATWEAHLGRKRSRELREALVSLREITDPYL